MELRGFRVAYYGARHRPARRSTIRCGWTPHSFDIGSANLVGLVRDAEALAARW